MCLGEGTGLGKIIPIYLVSIGALMGFLGNCNDVIVRGTVITR